MSRKAKIVTRTFNLSLDDQFSQFLANKDIVSAQGKIISGISGKAVPDDSISLQAETPHASRNSDGHAAIFDKKLFIVLSFHEETCE